MTRPLFISVLFFILGIIFSQSTNFLLGMGIIFCALIYIFHCYNLKVMLIFFTIFFCGLAYVNFFNCALPDEILTSNVKVTGIVKNLTAVNNYHRAIVKTIEIENSAGIQIKKSFNIQAYLSDKKNQIANVGEKIILTGKLNPPSKRRNPGGFDEENYFHTHLIHYKIFPNKIINGQIENHLLFHLAQLKNNLNSVYETIFKSREAAIIKSMITGDKSDLDDYTSQLYKIAGIYHILAISGLHISILALLLNRMLKFVFNWPVAGVISILLLSLYCIMTGSNISTVRATIMASVIIIGDIFYRERDLITSLSFAGFCLLIFNPYYIFDIGFQYSFGAVIGIASCNSALQRGFSILSRKSIIAKKIFDNGFAKKYFSASIAASLLTYIVSAYHFYYFTPYSIFANLFILPNIAVVVGLGFIVGMVGLFNLHIASFFSAPIFILLRFYEKVSQFFAAMPFAKILTGHINIISVIFYLVWIFLFIDMLASFNKNFAAAQKYFCHFSIAFALYLAILIFIPKPSEITMLDVGQGDCFVINCGQTFVIDGGGKKSQDIGDNTGVNILVPYLNYKAKDFVDAVFVTHSDADHIIGIIELIGEKRIGQIFLSELAKKFPGDELYQKLITKADEFSVPITYLKSSDVLNYKNANFYCVYPFENTAAKNNNDTSLVLKLNLADKNILMTGDAEKNGENEILLSGENIKSDILKLAHHGSKTSSTLEFLSKVNPILAIVSSGLNNSYGHPSQEIKERLKNLGIPLVNTAESGAVTIKFLDSKFKIIKEIE